jgi:Flp pilus assembly protein TadD
MRGSRVHWLWAAAGIVALALLAHARALGCGWIWDDDANVTACAPVLAWDGLARIWTDPTAIQQYYPLIHSTFWLEHKLWGLNPLGFHAVNVLLHALNALLLWRVLKRLGLPPVAAWLGGALFAVHPVQVESVAWITERKNTLSFAFYAGSALWWLRWRGLAEGGSSGEDQPRVLAVSFGLFVLALLSKSATSTLPLVLLILVWWKRGRWSRKDLSLLPYLAAAIGFGLLTIHLESQNVGTARLAGSLSLAQRVLVAGRAFWFYASKLVLPIDLQFVYPRWSVGVHSFLPWLFPLAAVALFVTLYLLKDRIGRGPLATVLAWTVTLAPTLGFIDVFFFRYSYVSDHFQYHASAAALALAGAGLAGLAAGLGRQRQVLAWAALAVLLLTLTVLSARRVATFQDERTLWTGTIQENPDAWIAWNNLGRVELDEGAYGEAERLFQRAIDVGNGAREPWNNLGAALMNQGRPAQAVAAFEQALAIYPGDVLAKENLGRALLLAGQLPRSIEVLHEAVTSPRHGPEPMVDLAEALAETGRTSEAESICQQARREFPADPRFDVLLANLMARRGALDDAVAVLEESAAEEKRQDPVVLDRLAMLYARQGRRDDAVRVLEEALALRPPPNAETVLRRHLELVRQQTP